MCSPLTRNLEASYGKYLSPLNATLKVQPLQIAEEGGARLDWVIAAKVSLLFPVHISLIASRAGVFAVVIDAS